MIQKELKIGSMTIHIYSGKIQMEKLYYHHWDPYNLTEHQKVKFIKEITKLLDVYIALFLKS